MSVFGHNVFLTDGSVLFCKYCEIKVESDHRIMVEQRIRTAKYVRAENRKKSEVQAQQLVSTATKKISILRQYV